MDCRKANIALITIVSTLLIITCLVLVKFLLSDSKGFSWGSVSDWFTAICSLLSAVGTLGTLYVAYKALKKVPEWMAQKHYDIAYGHIEKSIFNDLPGIRSLSLHLHVRFITIIKNLKLAIEERKTINTFTHEAIENIDEMVNNFQQECNTITNQLNAVKRTNYELTEVALATVSLLSDASSSYYLIYEHLFETYNSLKYEYNGDIAQKEIYMDKLQDLLNKSIANNSSISTYINEVYHGNMPISDFITPRN